MAGITMAETIGEPRAVSMLTERFETVFRGDSKLLWGSGKYDDLSQEDSDGLRVPFVYLTVSLNALRGDAANKTLRASRAVFVGAKDFRSPSGLGSVRSRFCYVILLEQKQFQIGQFFDPAPTDIHAGVSIWQWRADLKEYGEGNPKPSLLYAAQIAKTYVIVSNNLDDTKVAIDFLRSPQPQSSEPTWSRSKELLNGHTIWGYRKYRHLNADDHEPAGTTGVATGAAALLYLIDENKKYSTLIILSAATDTETAMNLAKNAVLPPLRFVDQHGGNWVTSFPLSGDNKSQDRVFYVMGLFGFGIYV